MIRGTTRAPITVMSRFAIANANAKLVAGKTGPALVKARGETAGESVVPFDYRTVPGKPNIFIPPELTGLDNWAEGTLAAG